MFPQLRSDREEIIIQLDAFMYSTNHLLELYIRRYTVRQVVATPTTPISDPTSVMTLDN